MGRLWKNLRTNSMYWRFRYITRNRLRLQSWWARRRQPRPADPYRPRGSAARVYRRTGRRTWTALLVMVALLTAISTESSRLNMSGGIDYALSILVVIGAVYWALRGV